MKTHTFKSAALLCQLLVSLKTIQQEGPDGGRNPCRQKQHVFTFSPLLFVNVQTYLCIQYMLDVVRGKSAKPKEGSGTGKVVN